MLNVTFAVIELIGGYLTQSAAIQADAIHDLGDSAALGAALVLQVVATLPPRVGYTYGLRRYSLVSAFVTSVVLTLGSVYVLWESYHRFLSPIQPHLTGMFGLAILGISVNGYAAWRMSKGLTQNEKALTWHMIEDLMGWVAVLVSSIVMRFVDWPWLDPLLAMVIGSMVLWGTSRSLWTSVRLFLQAVPNGVSEGDVKKRLSLVPGIKGIRSLQIWSLDGQNHVGNIHLDVTSASLQEWNELRSTITRIMQEFGSFELTVDPHFVKQESQPS